MAALKSAMREALELYVQGLTPKQVARRIPDIGKDTLNAALKNIRRQTGIVNARQAAAEYLRQHAKEKNKEMVILGVDPGLTTGWAVIDEVGQILGTGNAAPEDVEEVLDEIIRLAHRNKHVVEVVVERGPLNATGDLSRRLRSVVASIQRVVDTYEITAHTILPGVWKTSAVGIAPLLEEVNGRKMSPHERDATKMARYHLSRRQK